MGLTFDAAYRLRVQQLKAAGRTVDPGVSGQLYVAGNTLAVSPGADGGSAVVGSAIVGTAIVG